MARKTIPAISIVIPMYNTEKYIGECLDSILAQTFTDYEVIVVDDCSTDNSVKVVEAYRNRFNRGGGGQLQLIRSDKNSGGRAGIPRNAGIRISRGEYIMFVDSDDAITKTALADVSEHIKKFKPDVIHIGKYYESSGDSAPTDKKLLKESSRENGANIKKPTFESSSLLDRIKKFSERGIWWATVANILRRDFAMQNNIAFAEGRLSEDFILTLQIICLADKILSIPNCYYVYRKREGSTARSDGQGAEFHFENWFEPLAQYAKFVDNFMDKFEVLKNHPSAKYTVLDLLMQVHCGNLLPMYAQIPAWQFDKLIRRYIDEVGNTTALTAFLFSRMNVFNVQLLQQNAMIQQMHEHIQKQEQIIRQIRSQKI